MDESLDHYVILDVSPTVSSSELYFAFCVAVRQWLQSDVSFNHHTLTRLQESYRVLQDPIRRAAFHTESYGKHLPYGNQRKENQGRIDNFYKKTKKVPKWKNIDLSRSKKNELKLGSIKPKQQRKASWWCTCLKILMNHVWIILLLKGYLYLLILFFHTNSCSYITTGKI